MRTATQDSFSPYTKKLYRCSHNLFPSLGSMPQSTFEPSEFERRIEETKARMREDELDALVVADPANMNYLSGYDGWSFYVHQAVVVTADRDEPVWVGRGQDANGARA